MNDKQIEQLWREFEDVTTYEDENGALCIVSEWKEFEANTDVRVIWNWFNSMHSKGIYYLTEEMEC